MKTQTLLGLCLSASLVLAAPAAIADKGKGKSEAKKAQAMQIQIDKKTGKKLSAPDDADLSAKAAKAAPLVDARGMMPAESEAPQYHADGTVSAKLGTKNMKFAVLTIGEDGKKAVSHQTLEEFDPEATEAAKDTEEK